MLPKVLHRLTDMALILLILVFVAVIVIVIWMQVSEVDTRLVLPVQFIPSPDTYSLVSDSWGEGTIRYATGEVEFSDTGSAGLIVSILGGLAAFIVPAFIVLVLLRRIFVSMREGRPFEVENAGRIRWIGVYAIAFATLGEVAKVILGALALSEIEATGVEVVLRIQPNLGLVVGGMVILALAEVFRHGSRLQSEADFTV